jgi:hypothetical protein
MGGKNIMKHVAAGCPCIKPAHNFFKQATFIKKSDKKRIREANMSAPLGYLCEI